MKHIRKTIALICLLGAITASANEKDSLLAVIKNSKTDTVRASAYASLGGYYFKTSKDSARLHFREAIKLYSKHKLDKKCAKILSSVAVSFAMQGNQDSAIYYMKQSLSLHQQVRDSLSIAFAYNNLGLMHSDKHSYNESMKYLLKALEYKKKLANQYPPEKIDIASTEMNIGITFHYIEDYKNALKYYETAKKSYEKQKNEFGVANVNMQKANLYSDVEDYPKADSLYNLILEQKIFEDNPWAMGKIYNNYGELLLATKQYGKANEMLSNAYKVNMKHGNTRSAAFNLNGLAEIALAKQNYSDAIGKATESFNLSKANNYLLSEKSSADILSRAYEKTGNYKQSLEFHKIYQSLSDSLYNSESNKLLTEMETKYQNAEKEKQILLKEVELDKVKKSRQLFALTAVLLLLFSAFLYYLYRVRKKRNKELHIANNTKDKLISIIAHDLKNPAIAQKMAIEQLLKHVDILKEKELYKNLTALYQSSDSQVTLLLNLLNWAHTQTGRLEFNPVRFNLNDAVSKNIELFYTSAQNKRIDLQLLAEETFFVNADKAMVNTIIRNLISNAIKFSNQGQPILIKLYKKDENHLVCAVKDNGVGIQENKLKKLFQLETRELSKGTEGEEGTGLGLYLCKEMVERNNGTLTIESIENQGTTVAFTLPIN